MAVARDGNRASLPAFPTERLRDEMVGGRALILLGLLLGLAGCATHDGVTARQEARSQAQLRVDRVAARMSESFRQVCAGRRGELDGGGLLVFGGDLPLDDEILLGFGEQATLAQSRPLAERASGQRGPDTSACDFEVVMTDRRGPEASSNGRILSISRGMVDLARDDAALAFVIGHEGAHGLLHHHSASGRSRRAMESNADRFGLLLATNAGYRPQAGVELLRKIVQRHPELNRSTSAYPRYSQRASKLEPFARHLEAALRRTASEARADLKGVNDSD